MLHAVNLGNSQGSWQTILTKVIAMIQSQSNLFYDCGHCMSCFNVLKHTIGEETGLLILH